jgi:serine protease Do
MIDPWEQQGAAAADAIGSRGGRPALAWFFVALALAWLLPFGRLSAPAPVEQLQVQARTQPPIVAPTGELAKAFEVARDATMRIEVRCQATFGPRQVLGLGTGFFFRDDGAVLTAYHVVDASGASRECPVAWFGVLPDRREVRLDLVGFDAYMDLAVMQARVDAPVPFIPLARRTPTPGTDVVAIGNSRDDFLAARAGRITRLGVRAARADFADETIEMTNSLAPGDSGGPVLTARGEAVGVVSYISLNPSGMRSDTPIPPFLMGLALPRQFAAYAVPVGADSALVAALVAGAERDVPVIGFTWQQGFDYDPSTSDVDLGPRPGPIVGTVAAGGPAARAGLRAYEVRPRVDDGGNRVAVPEADVIVAIDGVATPTFADLLAVVRGKSIGQVVELSVQRGGATFRLPLELGARRAVFAAPAP